MNKRLCFSLKRQVLSILAVMACLVTYGQQSVRVTGIVTDKGTGRPLEGVVVRVDNSTTGVLTNDAGAYSITVNSGEQIQFSFVGYQSVYRQAVAGKIDVALEVIAGSLDEIVVVGYGETKKATLTGAIVSVKGDELQKSPATNFSNSLAGRLPGLVAITRTGEPGNDGSTLRIRGANTLGDNAPLVVVDGIANRSLDRLDPASIESVTVLKDASAAIYGAQAANGVILVTTKRGTSGKPTVSLNLNQGWNTPTVLPKMVDAATYAQIQNEISATYHPDNPLPFTPQDIQQFKDGTDPWGHPNTDWFKTVIKQNSPQRYGSVNLSGGSESVKYFTALGGNYTDGIYRNSAIDYSQGNFQSNLDAKVSENIRLSFDITGRQENRNYSGGGANGGSADPAQNIFWALNRALPTWPAWWPNGLPGPAIEYGANPAVLVTDLTGYTRQRDYILQSNARIVVDIPWIKGLSITANGAMDKTFTTIKQFRKPWTLYSWDKVSYDDLGQPLLTGGSYGVTDPNLRQSLGTISTLTLNGLINYDRRFDKHDLKVLVATEKIKQDNAGFWAFRRKFASAILDELDLGSDALKDNGGSSSLSRRLDYFGRVSYAYDATYMAEFVWRYDGSYIFDPNGQQFGFFPGISLGYRISNEKFWKNNIGFVDELKIRGSWGRTGNDRIAPYQYLTTYGYNGAYLFNKDVTEQTLGALRVPNAGVTWEVANQSNIGLDAQLLDHKLSLTADYFHNVRANILAYRNASVPASAGLTLPQENIGKVLNRGFELQIGYQDKLGEVQFSVSANGSYAKNKILFWDETPGLPAYQRSTGNQMNAALYYQAIGIFKDQADLESYPHWADARPGDIIFKDINNDGEINGLDMVRSNKTALPTFTGGLSFNIQYNNFDLSLLFQGAAGAERAFTIFSGGPGVGNFMESLVVDRWTPENHNGTNPRAWERGGAYWMTDGLPNNTFFVRNSDYVRLKVFELGYSMPHGFCKYLGLNSFRVYASGLNLLTFTSLKDFDPESPDTAPGSIWVNSEVYPLNKTINIGLSVIF